MENKSKKFIRGSEEAKEFMASLRAKKRIKKLKLYLLIKKQK